MSLGKFIEKLLVLGVILIYPSFALCESFITTNSRGEKVFCAKLGRNKNFVSGYFTARKKFISHDTEIKKLQNTLKKLKKKPSLKNHLLTKIAEGKLERLLSWKGLCMKGKNYVETPPPPPPPLDHIPPDPDPSPDPTQDPTPDPSPNPTSDPCSEQGSTYIKVGDFGIVPDNKEAATSNTIAFRSLVSPAIHGGTSNYQGKILFCGGSTYYFNNIIPFRDGIHLDLHGKTLHFEKQSEDMDIGSGFIFALRDFILENGKIIIKYHKSGNLVHAGTAIQLGSRNSIGSRYFRNVFDSKLEKPMHNFLIKNISIESNNSGSYSWGVVLLGGLKNVLFENVSFDGQNQVRAGIYYEFGEATDQRELPAGEVFKSSHASDMKFKNITVKNISQDGDIGIGLGITGAYDVEIDGLNVDGAYQGFLGSQGEAAYFNPWGEIPSKENRFIILKNIVMNNIYGTGLNLNGSGSFSSSYLSTYINSSNYNASHQSDHLNYHVSGFNLKGVSEGAGIYSNARSLYLESGEISNFKRGILTNADCMNIHITNSRILDNALEGINLAYATSVWPTPRKKAGLIENSLIAGNGSKAILINDASNFIIKNNDFAYSNEDRQTTAVQLMNNSEKITVKNNHNNKYGVTSYFTTSNLPDNRLINNTGNNTSVGNWQ